MARFPKGLLLLAGALELMILSVNGHTAEVPVVPTMPQTTVTAVDHNAKAAAPFAKFASPSVFGLVRRDPPKPETAKKQKHKPPKQQSGFVGQ